jgi:cytidylate kinase
MIIAIDGPSGAGTGTLARRLAAALDLAYLDTGMIYRATAAKMLAAGALPSDTEAAGAAARGLQLSDLERRDLRSEDTGQAASIIAAMAPVRAALLDLQRRFAAKPSEGKKGAILDGRDIGTVVCPQAAIKIFVTASPQARAGRRHKELLDRGEPSIYARVMQEMEARDVRDSGRKAAPLKPAPDALVLDTSDLDAQATFEAAMRMIAER